MKWGDGSHRPRRMTVEEFEEWNVYRTQRIPTHYPDGTVGEPYISVMMPPLSGRLKLKTKLTWWDKWRDRRWENRQRNDPECGFVQCDVEPAVTTDYNGCDPNDSQDFDG